MILHTEVLGDGEPLVFLHTGLQTGLTDFEQQREYFRSKKQVILPDLRGQGKSTADDLNDYFRKSAADLADTLTSLQVESAHIVGCSFGALVGLIFAKEFPEFVRTLTISGIIPEKPANWEEMNAEEAEFRNQLLADKEAVAHFNQLHGEGWKQFIQLGGDSGWYPFDETNSLETLKMPVLFMVGEGLTHEVNGVTLYPQQSELVHVAVIPFASHLVHTQQPEIYNKVLERFLLEEKA
ncbi:Pimeloyl-ACP methyl ester carboxylesterase [Halobacillus dabanensis]|uniref:Pimeloyl-ACP methyl ester carboxylesterase n=1 Tax=Halobacillus dabanensis TaxID=240302 RepID=A0A1I3PYK5_HALDA|nr:alpha/beta hydrolase [Halobacillus dabanensis]SFJ26500.1 Pimeloyl-ACP methyl ester carboxylesterase [Halobacillus dabanensis]